MDHGELTPTQKLRRKVIQDRYHQEIERMYEESHKKPLTINTPKGSHRDPFSFYILRSVFISRSSRYICNIPTFFICILFNQRIFVLTHVTLWIF